MNPDTNKFEQLMESVKVGDIRQLSDGKDYAVTEVTPDGRAKRWMEAHGPVYKVGDVRRLDDGEDYVITEVTTSGRAARMVLRKVRVEGCGGCERLWAENQKLRNELERHRLALQDGTGILPPSQPLRQLVEALEERIRYLESVYINPDRCPSQPLPESKPIAARCPHCGNMADVTEKNECPTCKGMIWPKDGG